MIKLISGFGLILAGFGIGADLDGVFVADEKLGELLMTKLGEFFGEEESMIKPAGADVFRNGGERDDVGVG